MSMIRSIQHMPGVITILSPMSEQLLYKLARNSKPYFNSSVITKSNNFISKIFSSFIDTSKAINEKYKLDIQKDSIPTFDQYLTILKTLPMHPDCKDSFKKAFPTLSGDLRSVNDLKVPTEVEFNTELQNNLGESGNYHTIINHENSFFKAPLVIDWENGLIATDEQGVERILQHYNKVEHHD